MRNRHALSNAGRLQRFALDEHALNVGALDRHAARQHGGKTCKRFGFVERARPISLDTDPRGSNEVGESHGEGGK